MSQPSANVLFKLATNAVPNRGAPVPGWKLHSESPPELYREGLKIASYLNETTRQLVFAFQIDINVPKTRDSLSHLKAIAASYIAEVKQQKRDFWVTFTGYRFGGSLAEAFALQTREPATTFETPGKYVLPEFDAANTGHITRYISQV